MEVDGSPSRRMRFAVEVLLHPRVRDPWGVELELIHTRLRYELTIELRSGSTASNGADREILRPYVAHESLNLIMPKDDTWLKARSPSTASRRAFFRYNRRGSLLETRSGDHPTFLLGQDGSAGAKQERPAHEAEATVLSSILTASQFKHLFALREEVRSWRFLQLDPFALRRPSPTSAAEDLEPDGSNLPTVLARLQGETGDAVHPHGVLADIEADLATMIPEITGIEVSENSSTREWELRVLARHDDGFSARVVSDGTLRLLALLTLMNDPRLGGLICFEEPENGIHPARLRTLLDHIRSFATDFSSDLTQQDPLPQLLVNSHSPVVLGSLREGEVFLADQTTVVSPGDTKHSRRTRVRPVRHTLVEEDRSSVATILEAETYLEAAQPSEDSMWHGAI